MDLVEHALPPTIKMSTTEKKQKKKKRETAPPSTSVDATVDVGGEKKKKEKKKTEKKKKRREKEDDAEKARKKAKVEEAGLKDAAKVEARLEGAATCHARRWLLTSTVEQSFEESNLGSCVVDTDGLVHNVVPHNANAAVPDAETIGELIGQIYGGDAGNRHAHFLREHYALVIFRDEYTETGVWEVTVARTSSTAALIACFAEAAMSREIDPVRMEEDA